MAGNRGFLIECYDLAVAANTYLPSPRPQVSQTLCILSISDTREQERDFTCKGTQKVL